MTENPILFSGPGVRAILEGGKSQTRQALKPQPEDWLSAQIDSGMREWWNISGTQWGCAVREGTVLLCRSEHTIRAPPHATGDLLWVKRSSRIQLRVESVRVERLQDISEEDARAEGCEADDISKVGVPAFSARQRFASLWESIHGAKSWASNPWVFAISFHREEHSP